MKKTLFITVAVLMVSAVFAQVSIKSAISTLAKEEEKVMSQGVKNALTLTIAAKADFVEDEWKDFLGAYKAKPKWMKKEKEWFSDNAIITELGGNNPVDVYAKIEEAGSDATILTVWIDLGGAYLSSYQHADKYGFEQKMLKEFNIKVLKDATQKEYDKEEKKYKKDEKNLKGLVSDKEDLLKDIENYKAKIKKAEDDIIKNEKNQKDAQKVLEDQKEVLKKVQGRMDELNKA
jgi:peptidoglycan hydrolase CwlO-like protein